MKRKLNNGLVLSKEVTKNGVCFYVDAGPEGKVLVWDSNLVPLSALLAAIAWYHDQEPPKEPHINLEFNWNGFRT